MVKCERNRDRHFKTRSLSLVPDKNKKRGGARGNRKQYHSLNTQGFTIEDILWAVGIWSVILTLSPVIVFYMLMVA